MLTAMGIQTKAIGIASTAMGTNTTASGQNSTAMGTITVANGYNSTAMGYQTTASGEYSTTMGYQTTASGRRSTAMGSSIVAQGNYSFGIGLDNTQRTITAANTMAIMGGNVGIGTVSPSYPLSVTGDIYADGGWLRASGNQGLYFESWGGGWHMSDATWIRAYNNKNIYTAGIIRTDGTLQVGDGGTTLNVTNGGNVGIGISSPSYKLTVSSSASGNFSASISNSGGTNTSHGLCIHAGSSSQTGASFVAFYKPNPSFPYTPTQIGSVTQSAASAVSYNTTSDIRLKENIRETDYTVHDLMKIKVVDFNFIFDELKTDMTGFIAQDMYETFPSPVTKTEDASDYWSIDYGKVTPLIVKAVQDQQEIIQSQQQQIESQQRQIDELKAMVEKLTAK